MAITSVLFAVVARTRWNWSIPHVVALTAAFLLIDLSFLVANVVKIEHGGWVPLVIAGGVFLVMTTWNRGLRIVGGILAEAAMPFDRCRRGVEAGRSPPRPCRGTAVVPHGGG